MRKSPVNILSSGILISSLAGICNAMPRAATPAALFPPPSVAINPWETKIDALREYILQQPDQNATKGRAGPLLQKTFADGECLEVRFINMDCFHDIPYKMRGVVKWLDDTNVRNNSQTIWDPYRYYTYGYYADPDNGWNFYGEARLTFGACGNRGPQSACTALWCVDKEEKQPEQIPKGQDPNVDPNNRDNLCPWLKGNGTASHTAYNGKG